MNTISRIRCRRALGLMALSFWIAAAGTLAGQVAEPVTVGAKDAEGFKEFSERVKAYVRLQRRVVASLPALKPTDLPEMLAAYQQALARKLREARPHAKPGDLFTSDAREAFVHVSRAALEGPRAAGSRAYMKTDAPSPGLRLEVNGLYPDIEPTTPLPPGLLAAYPPLPAEVAYRVIGRTLIVVDVESRLIVDIARLVLPPSS